MEISVCCCWSQGVERQNSKKYICLKICSYLHSRKRVLKTRKVRNTEIVFRYCSTKSLSLKMSQDSQDNTCARVCLVGDLQLHYKRDSGTGVFLLTFAEFFEKRRAQKPRIPNIVIQYTSLKCHASLTIQNSENFITAIDILKLKQCFNIHCHHSHFCFLNL